MIVQDKFENLKQVLPYAEAGRRFGYHSEANAYFCDAAGICHETDLLEQQLRSSF
jgi:hypothetical protein